MVLGPNTLILNGIWALETYYLGPWTLRVCGQSLENSISVAAKALHGLISGITSIRCRVLGYLGSSRI